MSMLSLDGISFAYDRKTPVLRNLSLDFECGKCYAIIGRSGAGKTTLLSLLACLVKPTKGVIRYDGKPINQISQYKYRSNCVGLVFQNYNLLPKLTALENVRLSMDIAKVKGRAKQKNETAEQLLRRMGLSTMQLHRRVLKLSGGQQQRVAIARAISSNAKVLLADEPTGNLDAETGRGIIDLMLDLAHNSNKCVIIVTHSPQVAEMCDSVYQLPLLGNRDTTVNNTYPNF